MAFLFASCGSDNGVGSDQTDSTVASNDPTLAVGTDSQGALEEGGLRITPMKPSGKFDDATLQVDDAASEVNEMFVKKYRFKVDGMDINDPANNIDRKSVV